MLRKKEQKSHEGTWKFAAAWVISNNDLETGFLA